MGKALSCSTSPRCCRWGFRFSGFRVSVFGVSPWYMFIHALLYRVNVRMGEHMPCDCACVCFRASLHMLPHTRLCTCSHMLSYAYCLCTCSHMHIVSLSSMRVYGHMAVCARPWSMVHHAYGMAYEAHAQYVHAAWSTTCPMASRRTSGSETWLPSVTSEASTGLSLQPGSLGSACWARK